MILMSPGSPPGNSTVTVYLANTSGSRKGTSKSSAGVNPLKQTPSTKTILIQSTICCGPGQAFPAQKPLQTLSFAPECGRGRGARAQLHFNYTFSRGISFSFLVTYSGELPKKGQTHSTPREEKTFVESSVAQANTCLTTANSRPTPFMDPLLQILTRRSKR